MWCRDERGVHRFGHAQISRNRKYDENGYLEMEDEQFINCYLLRYYSIIAFGCFETARGARYHFHFRNAKHQETRVAQFQHLSKNIASVNIVNNKYDVLCREYIIEEVSNV